MKNRTIFLMLLLALTTSMEAALNTTRTKQETIREEVKVEETFTRVKLMGAVQLFLTQAEGPHKVEIEGTSELLERLEISVEGDALVLRINNRNQPFLPKNTEPIHAYIQTDTIDNVSVMGAGVVILETDLKSEDPLGLSISGAGKIEAKKLKSPRLKMDIVGAGVLNAEEIEAKNLEAQLSGAAQMKLSLGKASESRYLINGSGSIDAVGVDVSQVTAQVNGGGLVQCSATQKLNAKVMGNGEIKYKGKPTLETSTPKKVRRLK